MELELIKQYAELLIWFKAAVTLAIILGTGAGAVIAMYVAEHRDCRELERINRELHRELDVAQKGHMIALATLAGREMGE